MRSGAGYRSEAGFTGGHERYTGPGAYHEEEGNASGGAGSGNLYTIYKNASTGGITSE